VLYYGSRRPVFELTRWTVYVSLAGITALGLIVNRTRLGLWFVPALSLFASTGFFVTTNLATWAEGQLYPMTWSGLYTCYVMAIPFFGNTVVADLIGAGVLFGLGPVFERAAARVTRAWSANVVEEPEAAELSEVA
jgi:hypothetical protein